MGAAQVTGVRVALFRPDRNVQVPIDQLAQYANEPHNIMVFDASVTPATMNGEASLLQRHIERYARGDAVLEDEEVVRYLKSYSGGERRGDELTHTAAKCLWSLAPDELAVIPNAVGSGGWLPQEVERSKEIQPRMYVEAGIPFLFTIAVGGKNDQLFQRTSCILSNLWYSSDKLIEWAAGLALGYFDIHTVARAYAITSLSWVQNVGRVGDAEDRKPWMHGVDVVREQIERNLDREMYAHHVHQFAGEYSRARWPRESYGIQVAWGIVVADMFLQVASTEDRPIKKGRALDAARRVFDGTNELVSNAGKFAEGAVLYSPQLMSAMADYVRTMIEVLPG